eukprot:m.16043 g.16043  ORF g.16043 m.16043 type:complete len:804 (-) comp3471_c0_seq1:1830-4241(-)
MSKQPSHKASSASAGEIGAQEDAIFRRVRGILNKLTPEKLDSLTTQLCNVGITTESLLRGVILLLFEKALDEPNFCPVYAQVCQRLSHDAPNFEDDPQSKPTFLKLLLRKCQEEFEGRSRACELAHAATLTAQTVAEGSKTEEDVRAHLATLSEANDARRKMLGNIRFIGELFKFGLLSEKIPHDCIRQLLSNVTNPVPDDVECLCKLLKTLGQKLDHPKAKKHMDAYFARLERLKEGGSLPSRIRFMIEDLVELRKSNWVPRRNQVVAGPKKIKEIRIEALKEQVAKASGAKSRHQATMQLEAELASMQEDTSGDFDGMSEMASHRTAAAPSMYDLQQQYHQQQQQQHQQRGRGGSNRSHGSPRAARGLRNFNMGDDVSLRPASLPGVPSGSRAGQAPAAAVAGPGMSAAEASARMMPSKPAQGKSKKYTQAELDQMADALLQEYLSAHDVAEACRCIKEMKSNKYTPTLLEKAMYVGFDHHDEERELICKLVHEMSAKGMLGSSDLEKAIEAVLGNLDDLIVDIPLAQTYLAEFCASMLAKDICSLRDLMPLFSSGRHTELFFMILAATTQKASEAAVAQMVSKGKIDLSKALPPTDRSQGALMHRIRDHNLNFLFPLLKVEDDLQEKINQALASDDGDFVADVQSWIEANVSADLRASLGFVRVLSICIVRGITLKTNMASPPTKEQRDEEAKIIKRIVPLLSATIGEDIQRQVHVLYGLQVYCYDSGFPKGMILRYFVHLYDLDVIEEDAYMTWREEVTDDFPGKGEALIAVNEYLNWMKTAEEESEEDEDDDDSDLDH